MQIRYGFKKEWLQFSRTFRLGGILIAIFSFALADPLMYMALNVMMNYMSNIDYSQMTASLGMGTGADGFGNDKRFGAYFLHDYDRPVRHVAADNNADSDVTRGRGAEKARHDNSLMLRAEIFQLPCSEICHLSAYRFRRHVPGDYDRGRAVQYSVSRKPCRLRNDAFSSVPLRGIRSVHHHRLPFNRALHEQARCGDGAGVSGNLFGGNYSYKP